MARMNWWIKERNNPQLGTYFVPCGQLKKTDAKEKENSLYGYNTMHSFKTKEEYETEIKRLRDNGERVHE